MSSSAQGWDLILPVKPTARAKSRLAPVDQGLRRRLAMAFALDVAVAAARSGRISRLCIVGEPLPLPWLPDIEIRHLTEPMPTRSTPTRSDSGKPDRDPTLNAAMTVGVREFRRSAARPMIALVADLPSLRASDLAALLDHFRDSADPATHGMITDLTGRGTTALLCGPLSEPQPRFGPDSAERHLQIGATDYSTVAPVSLRLDVDDSAQLGKALDYGVGPATARALAPG